MAIRIPCTVFRTGSEQKKRIATPVCGLVRNDSGFRNALRLYRTSINKPTFSYQKEVTNLWKT